jgi:hypothetical protein
MCHEAYQQTTISTHRAIARLITPLSGWKRGSPAGGVRAQQALEQTAAEHTR